MNNEEKANKLAAEIAALREKQYKLEDCYIDDMGNWTQSKARREHAKIERKIERLDDEFDKLGVY